MNRAVVVVLLALLPVTAGAAERREEAVREWDARGLARLEVDNPRGDVAVRASRDDRVHLVALKLVRNADGRGAAELARGVRVDADRQGDALAIAVRYPQRREIRLDVWDLMKGVRIPEIEVRVSIDVPAGVVVVLHTASGDVQTAGLVATQRVTTMSGDVDVTDARGPLTISTRSGDVMLGDVGAVAVGTASGDVTIDAARGLVDVGTQSGDVRIDSASDSVTVETASGEVRVGLARVALDVETASGDVTARAGGRVRVRTATGEAKVALVAPLRYADVTTASGDVSLRLGPGVEGEIDADAGSGDVSVDVGMALKSTHGNHVTGRLGRGTARLVVRSASGSVDIAR